MFKCLAVVGFLLGFSLRWEGILLDGAAERINSVINLMLFLSASFSGSSGLNARVANPIQ
jgi:hypothetical protein